MVDDLYQMSYQMEGWLTVVTHGFETKNTCIATAIGSITELARHLGRLAGLTGLSQPGICTRSGTLPWLKAGSRQHYPERNLTCLLPPTHNAFLERRGRASLAMDLNSPRKACPLSTAARRGVE